MRSEDLDRKDAMMAKGKEGQQQGRSIIELSCDEARAFLLKGESYCNFNLPKYFRFGNLLCAIANSLGKNSVSGFQSKSPREYDNVNHIILHNKDGQYAWRPLELIHPALYVSLVNNITREDHWTLIRERFHQFGNDSRVKCLSLPIESGSDQKDRAELVIQWWRDVEQKSIELSLDYEFMIQTDIIDCYPAIYTHSIAWALHTKPTAKANRQDKNLIGNIIDSHIQDMRQGQTNGIPQGSELMDLIGEMVLGYADVELIEKVKQLGIEDYRILRFRDDYRIFVPNRQDGERILKCLAEVMIELGLKLNPSKTDFSNEVIRSSIKDDKFSWLFRKQSDRSLQRHLLIIHDHSRGHPNSGSLEIALDGYYYRLAKIKGYKRPLPLISIVVDIAYRSPRTYPISSAILSELLSFLDDEECKKEVVKKVTRKFSQLPNTGHMEIWLQRVSHSFAPYTDFAEPLCKLIDNESERIWNSEWIAGQDLLKALNANKIVDRGKLEKMSPVISVAEVALFKSIYP